MKRTGAVFLPLLSSSILRALFVAGSCAGLYACGAAPESDLAEGGEERLATEAEADAPPKATDIAPASDVPAAQAPSARVAFEHDRQNAGEELAHLVAGALRDSGVREAFYAALAASPVKEGKLHLRKYLETNHAFLAAMTGAAGVTEEHVWKLMHTTRQLEIYMPVKGHRSAWAGEDDIVVAVLLDEHAQPFGVDLDGNEVALSAEAPPAVPTVAIVPAESFRDDGQPYEDHLGKSVKGDVASALDSNTPGLWINQVHIANAGDYEGWLMGDPEFEMDLMNADTRAILVCAHEGAVAPYRWNMNGSDYYTQFLLATSNQIPTGVKLAIAVYEDDDTRCKIKQDKDYLKLTEDALKNAFGVYEGIASKNYVGAAISFINTVIPVVSIVKGEDDFVGVAAATTDLGTSPTSLVLMNHNNSPNGWFDAQIKTQCGNGVCDTGEATTACSGDCGTCSAQTCGGQAPSGCWCDAECVGYGDCCANACLTCGQCP